MNTRREMGDLRKRGMGTVEANHIFQNVPMTSFTPGKSNYYHEPLAS